MYFSKKLLITSALSAGILVSAPAQGMSYVASAGNKMLSAISTFNNFAKHGSWEEQFIKGRCIRFAKKLIPGVSFVSRWGGYAAIVKQEWIKPVKPNPVIKKSHAAVRYQKKVAENPQVKPQGVPVKSFKEKTLDATKMLARLIVCDEAGSALSGKILRPLERATNRIFSMRFGTTAYDNAPFWKKMLHFSVLETLDEVVGFHSAIAAIVAYNIVSNVVAKSFAS